MLFICLLHLLFFGFLFPYCGAIVEFILQTLILNYLFGTNKYFLNLM